MKSTLFGTIVFLSTLASASAQIPAGTFVAGGSFSFSRQLNESGDFGTTPAPYSRTYTHVGIGPALGYALSTNLVVGLQPLFLNDQTNFRTTNVYQSETGIQKRESGTRETINSYGAYAFADYYHFLNATSIAFVAHAEAGAAADKGDEVYYRTDSPDVVTDITEHQMQTALSAGLAVLSRKISK